MGDWGRPEALEFRGQERFTSGQLRRALGYLLEVQLAAHPAAPLPPYLELIRAKLAEGYRRAGFPEVAIETRLDPAPRRILVTVREGPRLTCGEVRLSGVAALTTPQMRERILEALAGGRGGVVALTNLFKPLWAPGQPVSFAAGADRQWADRIHSMLRDLNYYQPRLTVQVIPDVPRGRADLVVEFLSEGVQGTIQEIEVLGCRKNSTSSVSRLVGLRLGQEVGPQLLQQATNRLWRSARFLQHDLAVVPLGEAGRFRLRVELREFDRAPALDQELSAIEQAALRFGEWLERLPAGSEDLVVDVERTAAGEVWRGQCVFSPSGLAVGLHRARSNAPSELVYGVVLSSRLGGLYSAVRQRKLVWDGTHREVTAIVLFLPSPGLRSEEPFQLSLGVGTSTPSDPGAGGGYFPQLRIAPVAALGMVSGRGVETCEIRDGVLHLAQRSDPGAPPMVAEIEAATGRLRVARYEAKSGRISGRLEVRPEAGAFARLADRLRADSSSYPDEFDTDSAVVSLAAFVVSELLEASTVESPWLKSLARDFAGKAPQQDAEASLATAQDTLRRLRVLLAQASQGGGPTLANVLAPLKNLVGPGTEGTPEGADLFLIPPDESAAGGVSSMAWAAAWGVPLADQLWPRGSWAWTLTREACFTVAGQPRYTEMELGRLLRSEEVGPLGCLAAARLVATVQPSLARAFGERGLQRLNAAGLRADFDLLLRTNTVGGQMLVNAVGLLGSLDEGSLGVMARGLAPADAAFLHAAWKSIRDARGQPLPAALWPVIEAHWDRVLRDRIARCLDPFLPQVERLSDPQVLYERGMALIEGKGGVGDAAEAVRCFRKAAEQGHRGAQLQLGRLLKAGRGVPADPALAADWFQKAAAGNELHAACELGRLYLNGQGVPKDQARALQWFRSDAERGCIFAQYWVGTLLDAQGDTVGALPWLRRAAEAGSLEAQYALGNRLSDTLSRVVDYREAYVWLSVAGARGNRVAVVESRRVKTRLSEAELAEAERRVAELTAKQPEWAGEP